MQRAKGASKVDETPMTYEKEPALDVLAPWEDQAERADRVRALEDQIERRAQELARRARELSNPPKVEITVSNATPDAVEVTGAVFGPMLVWNEEAERAADRAALCEAMRHATIDDLRTAVLTCHDAISSPYASSVLLATYRRSAASVDACRLALLQEDVSPAPLKTKLERAQQKERAAWERYKREVERGDARWKRWRARYLETPGERARAGSEEKKP